MEVLVNGWHVVPGDVHGGIVVNELLELVEVLVLVLLVLELEVEVELVVLEPLVLLLELVVLELVVTGGV